MNKINLKQIFRTTVFATLIAIVILAILFAAFSIVVLYSNISPTLITQISTILGAISLFLSAFITARVINKKGILIGLIFGLVASMLIFTMTLISTGVFFSVGNLTKILIITVSSILGGIFGVNSKN